jgi:hypothetical protein
MPYRYWTERPGERRCVNCDQRLVADSASSLQPVSSPPPESAAGVQNYVCPDDHERWAYNPNSREWRQMY